MRFDADGWIVADPGDPTITIIKAHPTRTGSLDDDHMYGVANHYTATTGGELRMCGRLVGKAGTPGASARNVSWHFCGLRDGGLVQCVSLKRGAHHIVNAGIIAGKRRRPNHSLVGIEWANAGHLHKVGEKFYASWKRDKDGTERKSLGPDPKSEIPRERVYLGKHPQEAFTDAQAATAIRLFNALLKHFPEWDRSSLTYTHEQFDAPRKADPGAAWTSGRMPMILATVVDPTPGPMQAWETTKKMIAGLL